MEPTNIDLIDSKKENWNLMIPVTTTDVVEGMTNNLHPQGLYSTEIFGRMGSRERKTRESYINLKLKVFVPIIFNVLKNVKSLYVNIMKGTEFAIWDEQSKDFIKSNILEGETGYSFFMRHFNEINFKENSSPVRIMNIELLHKFKDNLMTTKWIVLPAGLREIEFGQDGSITEPEINDLYRKILFKTNSIIENDVDQNNPVYDNVRWGIQEALNNLDSYLFDLLDGKRGFIRKKMATRTVVSGTRNVITAKKTYSEDANESVILDPNSCNVGLFQSMMAFSFLTKYCILNSILNDIFVLGSSNAKLVNKKTLDYEYVEVGAEVVNKWITSEGINKLMNGYKNTKIRNNPIIINDYYLCLTYNDGVNVRIFSNISELPEEFDKKHVKPTTYCEFFYYFVGLEIEKKACTLTRYPIEGQGSIYPVLPNVKTNSKAVKLIKLDEFWDKTKDVYYNFPDRNDNVWIDSLAPPVMRVKGMGGDFDGDQCNFNPINGSDSLEEVNNYFNKREFYINGLGEFNYQIAVESSEFLLKTLTTKRQGLEDNV